MQYKSDTVIVLRSILGEKADAVASRAAPSELLDVLKMSRRLNLGSCILTLDN
jgi:hypothetical protein